MTKQFRLEMAHCSMQFSDTTKQMRSDVEKIFDQGYHIITGTEAGADNPLSRILPAHAKKVGFKLHLVRDVWVAVDKRLVTGGWKTGYVPVIESAEGAGKHTDKGVGWAGFDNQYLGTITVGVAHLLTRGREPGDVNYRFNKRFGRVWEEWLEQFGKGTDLAFAAADQNIPDRDHDTFFGADLTSSWDELGRYENTGHGNIDVIASYDKDGRVKAKRVRALDDREFHLHTDHFLVESSFDIELLKNSA